VISIPEDDVIEAEVFEGSVEDTDQVLEPPDVVIPELIELDLDESEMVTATTVSEGAVTIMQQGNVTIAVVGEPRITEDCADEVRTSLLLAADQTGRLVIDMAAVEFMSSIGIAALLGTMKQVGKKKGKMVLCGVQPAVVNILEATGLMRILKLEPERDAAIKAAQ
jgi:anti-anti-sigma factor